MSRPLPSPLRPLGGDPAPGAPAAAARLRALGVAPHAWSNGPGDRYAAHEHATTKLLVCAQGSITFLVGPDEAPVELRAGDGFVLPAGTRHAAVVGDEGCACLEGHRPAEG
ncbi:MAG TPA: cupin domain-containing protein [Candidatus Limnocylindria bacterium]